MGKKLTASIQNNVSRLCKKSTSKLWETNEFPLNRFKYQDEKANKAVVVTKLSCIPKQGNYMNM